MPTHAPKIHSQSILWQRLDEPGHDTCTVKQSRTGWRIEGMAVSKTNHEPSRFSYIIHCNTNWRTERAVVVGRIGEKPISARIVRSARGHWKLNGVNQKQLIGCDDLDLAFTPATNTIAIRRLMLQIGDEAALRSAWLNIAENEFSVLEQRYERLSVDQYQYASARFDFRAKITVNAVGLVTNYPPLWSAER